MLCQVASSAYPFTFICPGGGKYSINATTKRVVCSIPEHMFDTCQGNRSPPEGVRNWLEDYRLDYRNSDTWWYRIEDTTNGTILRMSGATVVFKGCYSLGVISWGTMQIAGSGTRTSQPRPSSELTVEYGGGVVSMQYAGHVLKITDHGHTLGIDTNTFDLFESRPKIVMETNGVVQVEETTRQPNQVPEDTARKLADPQH